MNWIMRIAGGAMRPRLTGLLCVLTIATTVTSGCATTHVIVRAINGDWMESEHVDHVEWVNGEPSRNVTVEARLTTPPRVICLQRIEEPSAKTHLVNVRFDPLIRVWTGLLGATELALSAIPVLINPDDDLSAGSIVGLSLLAADGLSALLMAALIPTKRRPSEAYRHPETHVTDLCPAGLAFELGAERFPIFPDGGVLPEAATYIMREVVETGAPLGLRNGDTLTMTVVPPDIRCAWAARLNHPAERALCPQAPGVIRVHVPVPVAVPVPVPARLPPPRR